MEIVIAILLGANLGFSLAVLLSNKLIRERQLKLMEGQILLMDFAAEGGKFLSQVQSVQIMARRDMEEETMQ